ncbi:MAG: redoxin domain-containing protein [Candidatus Micrarchaeia archaeon]|jgi:peroxiredoxin (alkyl hydroperoxide reductase subunit C)
MEIGAKVPEFTARTYFPKEDKIAQLKIPVAGKWNVITFHPGDFTFVCATDIEAFGAMQSKFEENGAVVLAVSTDSIFAHRVWHQTSPRVGKTNIPLVEDLNKTISAGYGFLSSNGSARRGVVIIDPEGNLQYYAVFNDALGKDVRHIYNAFLGLKSIHDAPKEEGKMSAIPANWEPGKPMLVVDTTKDIGKL